MSNDIAKNSQAILAQCPTGFDPKTAIILGSGLGDFIESVETIATIPYQELDGLTTESTVVGHSRQFRLARCEGVPLVILEGRFHYYEGIDNNLIHTLIRTVKAIGVEQLLITNAAGSLHQDLPPGSLVGISDHINFLFRHPLTGPNDDDYGPRFLDMTHCYNSELRQKMSAAAKSCDIAWREGVYIAACGPTYETAAEIRAFAILGADVVGMSTVPEAIVAHHCGMMVGAISVITNYATGLAQTEHSHDEVVATAQKASQSLSRLCCQLIKDI